MEGMPLMDQDWTRKEARRAAREQVASAEELLRSAQAIFRSNDYDVDALNVGEALVYTAEVGLDGSDRVL
jgi:hypothetical protein